MKRALGGLLRWGWYLAAVVLVLCAALVTLHPDAALAASSVMLAAGLLGQLSFHIARPAPSRNT